MIGGIKKIMANYEIKILDRKDYPNCVKLKAEVTIEGETITEWFGFSWEQMLENDDGERICDRNLKEWARKQLTLLKDDTFTGLHPTEKAPKKGEKIIYDETKDKLDK